MVGLEATGSEWLFSPPHCRLARGVTGPGGKVVQWRAGGQAPQIIFPAGYRKDSFKAGDQVSITVEPVKENLPMGRILQAVLADGKFLGRASSAGAIP